MGQRFKTFKPQSLRSFKTLKPESRSTVQQFNVDQRKSRVVGSNGSKRFAPFSSAGLEHLEHLERFSSLNLERRSSIA